MKLSAPIHRLKRHARTLSRDRLIPLHEALDRVAALEGYAAWSHLAARYRASRADGAQALLQPGDLMLIAARPRQGKTLMALHLAAEAAMAGRRAFFFSVECTEREVHRLLRALDVEPSQLGERFVFDGADRISADHIKATLAGAARGAVAFVDYLQVLDQDRSAPTLAEQVLDLRPFAQDRGISLGFISQVDRTFDLSGRPCPDIRDLRLPNPLDLSLFSRGLFLNQGQVHCQQLNPQSFGAM